MSLRVLTAAGLAALLAGCPAENDPTIEQPCTPGEPACPRTCDTFRTVGSFELCAMSGEDAYTVVARYTGTAPLDVAASELRVAGDPVDAATVYDAATSTFTLEAADLAPGKYSVLLRAATTTGAEVRPLFVPMWISTVGASSCSAFRSRRRWSTMNA